MSKKFDYINIIFLSNDWNGYHRKAFTEEIIKELNPWSEVIILQLPVSIFIHFFTNFKKRIIGLFKGTYRSKLICERTFLYTPVILFHYLLWDKNIVFFRIDSFLLNYQLKRFIKRKFGNRKQIIWYYFPQLKYYAEKSNADIKIYDQYDIYHMDINEKIDIKLKKLNEELIKISDIILNTTNYLFEISNKINKNSYYITNGNNFSLLSGPVNNCEINLPLNGAKTIGYLGGIRDWIDFELLEFVIKNLNNINFLLIGPVYPSANKDMEKIKSYKNVLWLNYVQPENLPSYLSLFDAGLIPFKQTEFFKCVFPNKFFEYLASGIPVVTTALVELKKYENIIGYSYDKNDFQRNCEKALKGEFEKYYNEYKKIAKENSWSVKAKETIEIIQKTINKKLID